MNLSKAGAIKFPGFSYPINSVNTFMKKITITTTMTGFTILLPLLVKQ